MPQTPLRQGEPTRPRPREDESRWFEPVTVARESAEAAVPGAAAGQGVSWRDMRWVGFAGEPVLQQSATAKPGAAVEPVATQDELPCADHVDGAPRAGDGVAERAAATAAAQGGDRLSLRRRLGAGVRRVARLGGAVASAGVIGIFVYYDNDRLGGLSGTMARPSESVGNQAAAPAVPDMAADRQAAAPAAPEAPAVSQAVGTVAADASAGREDAAPALPDAPASHHTAAPVVPDPPAGGQGAADDPRAPVPPPSEPPAPVARYLDRAKSGDPVAQYNLAVVYARGDEVAQNYASAATWFREAAANGNLAAQFNLGVVYERGLGVAPDMTEAVAWYRRAAERRYPAAEYNLAIAYARGRGTPPDPAAAAHWYRRAAQHGLAPAMVNLAILYEMGDGVEPSLPDAYAWYRAAARRGDVESGRRAGELFQQLTGAAKAQAVLAAAAVVEALREPAAEPPEKAAAKSGNGKTRTPRD